MQDKWDIRFLKLAREVSTWSKDPSTQTGAVVVRPNNSVASVGFNGFPKNMTDRPEWYENREEKYSRIVHCEINALIFTHESVHGYTLYTWPFASCDRCCVVMLQAGIKRYVFPECSEELKTRWADSLQKSLQYITESGGVWKEYSTENF